jgi:hypothetical protein
MAGENAAQRFALGADFRMALFRLLTGLADSLFLRLGGGAFFLGSVERGLGGARGLFRGDKARGRGLKRFGLFRRRGDTGFFVRQLSDLRDSLLEAPLKRLDRPRDRPAPRIDLRGFVALFLENLFGGADGVGRRVKPRFRRLDAILLGGLALAQAFFLAIERIDGVVGVAFQGFFAVEIGGQPVDFRGKAADFRLRPLGFLVEVLAGDRQPVKRGGGLCFFKTQRIERFMRLRLRG